MAAFLLLSALLVVAALVDTGLQTQAKAEQYLVASVIANDEQDRLRSYATRFGIEQLDGFDGQDRASESDPTFRIRTTVENRELPLPNSSLEELMADADKKRFTNSARLLGVSVRWSEAPQDRVELFTLIGGWQPADFEVRITSEDSLEVPPDGTISLRADAGGLTDLVYTWYTEPLDGLGSIKEVSRDGQSAVYINRYRTPSNSFDYYPGSCRVVVRAVYRNVEKLGFLEVVNGG